MKVKFLKKITKTIDIGCVSIDLVIGVGICIGKYEELDSFIDCAYVASDYANKRKKYNIVNSKPCPHLECKNRAICEGSETCINIDIFKRRLI